MFKSERGSSGFESPTFPMWRSPTPEYQKPPPPSRWPTRWRSGVEMGRRVLALPKFVLIPIVVAFVVALILVAGLGTGLFANRTANHSSSSSKTPGAPTVRSSVVFGDNTSLSTASPRFTSSAGDAIFAWISLYGQSHVVGVTDSVGDSFHQVAESGMPYGTTGAYNGLALWGATAVGGGPSVTLYLLMATSCSPCAIHSAVIVIDVTGVSTQAIDQVGTMVNSSALPNQQSKTFSCSVLAHAPDLILAGVAARNRDNFTASLGDTLVNQEGTLGTNAYDSMTTAVFEATQKSPTGTVWMNGTDNQSSAWVAGAISLLPAGLSPSTAPIAAGGGLPLALFFSVAVRRARSSPFPPGAALV
jgi:hypothetical protein